MKEEPLDKSSFSFHFIMLTYMGAWVIDTNNPKTLNAYVMYKVAMTLGGSFCALLVIIDFFQVFGDLKKMSWNLCVNMLIMGGLTKLMYNLYRSNVINSMRTKLHRSAITKGTGEDEVINKIGERELLYIRIIFYGGVVVVVPLWVISWYFSYLWGPRGIPVPVYLPFDWDPDDELQYNVLFFSLAICGCGGVVFVIELEMAMFSILIQICREYNRLLKDLKKTNEMYTDESYECEKTSKKEVNPLLRKSQLRSLLKQHCDDHQQLLQYTKDFELSYGYVLLLQMIFLPLLITFLAMLCVLEYGHLSMNLTYQLGCMSLLIMDMFLVCWFSSRIHAQCRSVGEEAYSIPWYQMSPDIQKDISMLILRSQNPPKITSGKLMEMNLHAFLIMIRNVYSYIALFRQVVTKSY